jgi:8-oxo-dGTP pyrophosphatase MutT (NUDIX family)
MVSAIRPEGTAPAMTAGDSSDTGGARHRVVEAIVFRRTDPVRVLLLRRTPQRGGWWQAVTGSVEAGEGLEQAVRREVREETGIGDPVAILDLDFAFPFEFTKYGGDRELAAVKHSFAVEVAGNAVTISDEHDDWGWVTPAEALERLTWEDNREALRRLAARLPRGAEESD